VVIYFYKTFVLQLLTIITHLFVFLSFKIIYIFLCVYLPNTGNTDRTQNKNKTLLNEMITRLQLVCRDPELKLHPDVFSLFLQVRGGVRRRGVHHLHRHGAEEQELRLGSGVRLGPRLVSVRPPRSRLKHIHSVQIGPFPFASSLLNDAKLTVASYLVSIFYSISAVTSALRRGGAHV